MSYHDKNSKSYTTVISIVASILLIAVILLGKKVLADLNTNIQKTTVSNTTTSSTVTTTQESTTTSTTTTTKQATKLPCYNCGVIIEENIFAGHNICKNCIENHSIKISSCATKEEAIKELNNEYKSIYCYHCGKEYYEMSGFGDSDPLFLPYSVCPNCGYRNLY